MEQLGRRRRMERLLETEMVYHEHSVRVSRG
jgi:hypothetical protein